MILHSYRRASPYGVKRRRAGRLDWPLIVVVYAMSLFGIYCISSATFDPDKGTDLSLLNYILNSRSSLWQSIFVLLSPVVLTVVAAIPMELYRNRVGKLIYYGVLALLVVTLLTSKLVNGINAWLQTGFGRAIQPCEFAKISVLIVLARILSQSKKPMGTFREFLRVCLVVGVPAGIVLLQGETGSVIVIGVMFLCMIYFAGVDIRLVLGIVLGVMLAAGGIVAYALITGSTDYRIIRLLAFTDPQKYSQGGGYQLLQSQVAIGSGQLTGLGTFTLGTTTQLGNVPENSTDFILSTIAEAFGFVGVCAVLAAYLFILLRMMYLSRTVTDRFSRLLIVGVMSMLMFHVVQNMGMCMGLMPITGIPLPFLSYGGSNYMTNMIGLGLVLGATRNRVSGTPVLTGLT